MPLVTSTEMFKKAYEGGYAIGAFNVNNMEIIQGIVEAGKLEAVGYDADHREIARSCRITAGEPASIGCRIEREPSACGSYIFAELFLTDAQGNEIDTAGEELEIEISGGTLIGVDNGDARSLLPFKRSFVNLYNGRAMATAYFEKGGTVTVRCAGLAEPCRIKV